MSKLNKDSVLGTFVIIVTFCLVCSVLVSSAVVALDPFKAAAVANDRQVNILKVSGFEVKGSVAKTFKEHIESHLIDVETGSLADDVVPASQIEGYNFASLAKKPASSVKIPKDRDVAGILSRAKYMPVYFAKDENGKVARVILPFYGQALWSTVYGYVALSPVDANTILGVTFYSHGETPGLGGEIDNPRWQAQWVDKKLTNENGEYKFHIVKNAADKNHEIDALSGATLTSVGVDKTAAFWLGDAYKPFLEKLSKGEIIVNE
ncbi:Na+-transporting NADH:ubiquinone oxidoreductase subunit C [Succinivibrio dextrinosolvens]|uniref:Na(+)-translocating NADH-quinone reductase subunit C n=1 Tax=Succinivibrio dextrinosolvens TaxID=83771 RepID=UPI0008E98520|nr:Na(+)-translocating NADH-quinone reductase subunit C [Succinivibrio dextrinosolvens]SFS42325.1 Na+-transporting NADH:ubiquinone oxidoreductase subunit C [Succinivibrio dextrinosolvens]